MKKKLLIIILSVITLIFTPLISFGATVTTKLPDNLSAVPIEYMSFRAYDGTNTLQWLNLADQRIVRNNSSDNLNYSEYVDIFMPNDEHPISGEYNVQATSSYATMRYRILEKIYKTNIFSPSSYIHFSLEDIGVTPPQSNKRVIYFDLDGYTSNAEMIRYADVKYTQTTVNNLTGQVIQDIVKLTVTPTYQYYEGIGYQHMLKVEFPTISNTPTLYTDISIKLYYLGDIQQLTISSPSMNSSLRTQELLDASIAIGQKNGSFQTVDVPTDWFGWVVNGVNGFMALQILPNVTLWTVFYAIVGLTLFIFIMKKFAGG